MSDCILVVNENGYWGDSTKSEIEYAVNLDKPVFYCFDFDGYYNHYNDTIFDNW